MDKNYSSTFVYCTLKQGNAFSKSVLNSLLKFILVESAVYSFCYFNIKKQCTLKFYKFLFIHDKNMYLVGIQFIFAWACSFGDEIFHAELHLHENWIKFSFTSIIVNSIFVRPSLPSKLHLNTFKNVPDIIAAWVRFLVPGTSSFSFVKLHDVF